MIAPNSTFSADVKLWLHIDGESYELGHLGPSFALLGEARAIKTTIGELETIIDGDSTRWPIKITSKISGESKRFTFESVG